MRVLKAHFPVLSLLGLLVVLAFGRLTSIALWNPLDLEIIRDSVVLSADPWPMFARPGVIFSQPILQLAFLGEYLLFGLDGGRWLWVNLGIHTLNAFLVYLLVHMLFYEKKIAVLAGVLVALCVGNYGKILMTVAFLESLLLVNFQLLVLYFLIRNDFKHRGRLRSPYFLLGLLIFLISGLTRASAFSLLGCLLAYKFFFFRQGGRRAIFSRNLLVLVVVGILLYIGRSIWLHRVGGDADGESVRYSWLSIKNIFRYVNLMLFPLQTSQMLDKAHPVVQLIYDVRTPIRLFLSLSVISYSFFGFVFGNKALRFFIAWSYISLAPFTYVSDTGGWLNLQHLYLASFGFSVILAVASRGISGLLRRHHWRSLTPYLLPVFYICLSVALAHQMMNANRARDRIDLSGLADPGVVSAPAERSPFRF